MVRCICQTLKGEQCKKEAVPGKTMCSIHEKKCLMKTSIKEKTSVKKVKPKKTVTTKSKKVKPKKVKPKKTVTTKSKKIIGKKIGSKVERILNDVLQKFPDRKEYLTIDYDENIVPQEFSHYEKERYGFLRPLWWDYYPEEGVLADERLDSRYHKIEETGQPQNRSRKTRRICIYNQFRDYTGLEALSYMLSNELQSVKIHHRIIGYELDSFIINLFIGSSENEVITLVEKFLTKNKVRMDEDWRKNYVSLGRLYNLDLI